MVDQEKPSYYAIIPANIRYDNNLKSSEKLMYGEITCLSNKTGKCLASNDYFAKLYGVSNTTVSTWISSLVNRFYVKREIIYKQGTKEILHRYLSIIAYPPQENLNTPTQENLNTPTQENLKDNNTSINNTSNNNKTSTKQTNYQSFIEYLKNNVSIPSKVTSTKQGKDLFNNIANKKQLCIDYINHQEDKAEFSKRITSFMEDYKIDKKVEVANKDISKMRFSSLETFNNFNIINGYKYKLLEDGFIKIKDLKC